MRIFLVVSSELILISALVLCLLFFEFGSIALLQTLHPSPLVKQLTLGTPSEVPVPKKISSFFNLFIKNSFFRFRTKS